MSGTLSLYQIDQVTGGRLGRFDAACPICGPERRTAANRTRKVLRIWRLTYNIATYHCARCGERGYSRDRATPSPDPAKLAAARLEAAERERSATTERLAKARWLWSRRRPVIGTAAEVYLREARAYTGPIPETLGFLPGREGYPPAMIAAFGLPTEPEPGRIQIADAAVTGVHVTRLAPNGHGKAGTDHDKIMIGKSAGSPVVVAPPNDLLGLAIAEGIEDALSIHEAMGLGAWAAGAASRLPMLANAIPTYIESVTLLVDDDPEGHRHAARLAELVAQRAIEVRSILLPRAWRAAV
jgi:hypothetical protein